MRENTKPSPMIHSYYILHSSHQATKSCKTVVEALVLKEDDKNYITTVITTFNKKLCTDTTEVLYNIQWSNKCLMW